MRKTVWTGLALAGLAVFALNCAPKPTEKELSGKIKGRVSLRLADGSPVSTDEADEYNPYIVKLSDDYLVLVFGSNRTCGSCSGHNIFMAKSISPYAGLTLPFFNTPVVVTDSAVPLNLTESANFAAVANTTNVVLYVNDNAGAIQKGTITNPSAPNTSFVAISNTGSLNHKVIGVSSSGGDLVTVDGSGISYTSNPNTTESPTPYGFGLDSAVSATQVRLDNSGFDDSYMAVSSFFGPFATPIAVTKAFPFGPIINFDIALLQSGLSITHINTLYGDTAANDIVLFSARDEGSADLYVVTSHTSKDLWDEVASFGGETLGPPPPDHWFNFDMPFPCGTDIGFNPTWSPVTCGFSPTSPSYNFTDYADLNGSVSMDLGTVDFDSLTFGFTIAAWVKVDSACASANCTIVANTSSLGTIDGFRFYYDGVANQLKFYSRATSAATAQTSGSELVENGTTWQHVAVVVNPSSGYAYLYVDGDFAGVTTTARTAFPTSGQAYMGQTTDSAEYFNGGIDDLMVFEYELFDEEIAMLAFGF